jgi:hypothetical protein
MKLCKEAKKALEIACEQNHPITNLEYLGFDARAINALESSSHKVETIEGLMSLGKRDLQGITNIGDMAITKLEHCLNRYHELEEEQSRYNPDLDFQRRRLFPHRFKKKKRKRELGTV